MPCGFPALRLIPLLFARKMAFLPSFVLSIYSCLRQRRTMSPDSGIEMGNGGQNTTSNHEQGGEEEGALSGWFKFDELDKLDEHDEHDGEEVKGKLLEVPGLKKKTVICGPQMFQAACLIEPGTNDPRYMAWARAVDRPLAMVTVSRPLMELGMECLSHQSNEAEEKVIAHPTPGDDEWWKLVEEAISKQHRLSPSFSLNVVVPSSGIT